MSDLYLVHSTKGTTWAKNKHKYIRKDGNRYIYADGSASAADKPINKWFTSESDYVNPHNVDYTVEKKNKGKNTTTYTIT